MPMMQAFCDTCGTMFSSGIFVENSTISLFGNKAGPCPKCGGMGHIPDGIFKFIGNTIEILSAPQRTLQELIRFADVINEAQKKKYSSEEVIEKVKQDTPEFSSITDLLPKNRGELYAFLALLLTMIQILMQSPEKPSQNITNNINITQVIEQTYRNRPIEVKKQDISKVKKVGRNDLCPCGSEKKYKKCCGSKNIIAIEETKYLNSIPNMAQSITDAMNAPDSEFSESVEW